MELRFLGSPKQWDNNKFGLIISLQELRNSNSTPTPESPLKDATDKSKKRPMSSSISKSPTVKYAARAKQPEKLTFLKKVR